MVTDKLVHPLNHCKFTGFRNIALNKQTMLLNKNVVDLELVGCMPSAFAPIPKQLQKEQEIIDVLTGHLFVPFCCNDSELPQLA